MKKANIKKLVLGYILCLTMILAIPGNIFGDERGCLTTYNNVGNCQKNTEGIWKCMLAQSPKDCTSSNT